MERTLVDAGPIACDYRNQSYVGFQHPGADRFSQM